MSVNQLAPKEEGKVTIQSIVNGKATRAKLEEMLGKKAAGFASSIIAIANSDNLKDCDPMSVYSSAMVAATMDLPINPNFGMAYVVPYNDKKKGKIAQFQMGYKGFIQLALRSGQFKNLNAGPIFEGEIKRINRLTGVIEFNEDTSQVNYSNTIGYFAYFQLVNGFEKCIYMSKEEAEAHGKRYSQSYKSDKQWVRDSSLWATDFDTMATKTVVKALLSKYAPLSIEMQTALENDVDHEQTAREEQREMTASKEFEEVIDTTATEIVEEPSKEAASEPVQQTLNDECPI